MKKLNDYIAHFKSKNKDLADYNFNINSEYSEALISLEKEVVQMEIYIDKLKEEKSSILQQILENEK